MTINQKIIKALKPLGIPVTSDFFGGGNSEYITFNYVKDGLPGSKKKNSQGDPGRGWNVS